MKKITCLMLGLFYGLFHSQTQDLATIAQGKYLGLQSISDNEKNLFGYMALYDLGKTENDKKKNKLEYFLFDKNLNSLSTGNFESDETAVEYYPYLNSKKQLIITPSFKLHDYAFDNSFYVPSDFIIDLHDYQIKKKDKLEYDGTNLTSISSSKTNRELKDDNKDLKKEKGYKLYSEIVELDNGQTVISEFKDAKNGFKDIKVSLFSKDHQKLWEYPFFDKDHKNNSVKFKIANYDDDVLIAKIFKYQEGDPEYYFMVFDMKTGKVLNQLPFPYETHLYISLNSVDGIINSKYNTDKTLTSLLKYSGSSSNIEGFVKLTYDKTRNQLSFNETNFQDHYKDHKDIEELKEPFDSKDLDIKSVNFLQNNDVFVILQKINRRNNDVSDLVVMDYDPDMNLRNIKTYPSQKNSTYLFSQYLNDKKDIAFFYANTEKKNKEKKWSLYINTFINGQFKQEVLPMSSENNFVIPYNAKEGYILLQELNEKEKYNKIRLERLNY
ncbi:hypothetical protein [Chryseobacterium sp. IT-36CA2]|uniref:hypothetical protein n=1 Tax=Chryseobacterium sp. IT-36CA2 TaxID=3026460 RepID=UPI0039E16EC9